jgi:hypothetical protein
LYGAPILRIERSGFIDQGLIQKAALGDSRNWKKTKSKEAYQP